MDAELEFTLVVGQREPSEEHQLLDSRTRAINLVAVPVSFTVRQVTQYRDDTIHDVVAVFYGKERDHLAFGDSQFLELLIKPGTSQVELLFRNSSYSCGVLFLLGNQLLHEIIKDIWG